MSNIENAAQKLAASWTPRAGYEKLDGDLAPADLAEAYEIQRRLQELSVAQRGPIAGRKIALSSKAMQEMVGIDAPIAGAIFTNDVHHTPAAIARSSFRGLGLEYELAFKLAVDATPAAAPYSPAAALAMVGAVCPAFELIEDRQADYSDLCPLTLTADNAWCGGVVLGEEITDWQSLDLGNLPAVLEQDGQPPEAANTGAADPVASLAWVLNHAASGGETIRAGEYVITGSVLRTRFPEPGDHLRYVVDGRAAVEISVT